jgi:hypothetical protein
MTPCSLVEVYRRFAHLLLYFPSRLYPYRKQEFPKRHVWEDSTFNCVGDHNLRTYNIMKSSIKCSSYLSVCPSVRVSCAPNELVSVIRKNVSATSIHPQTHEPSPHTPQHDRHLPNAPRPLSFSAPMSEPIVPKRFPCLFQVSILTGLPRVQLVVLRHRRYIWTYRSCCCCCCCCCCVVLRFVLVAVCVDVGQGAGTGSWWQ